MANTSTPARCAALAALILLVAACGDGTEPGVATGSASSTASQTGSASAPATGTASATGAPGTASPTAGAPASRRALPVYYVVDTAAGPRLYREFHSVVTADPASDAVREMLARPSGTDPDYRSLWAAGTRLLSPVRHDSGVITVDLSGLARTTNVGAEHAELTVQQLVYTVQGALQSSDPVRILVDGAETTELWGHVSIAEPVRRADPYATRSPVQIDSPAHGARVGRTFTVSGEASTFEANVPWQVLRGGTVVRSGFTTAAEGQRFSAFSFSLTLEPGDYTLRVTEDDPSDGAARPPFVDTKDITVTG